LDEALETAQSAHNVGANVKKVDSYMERLQSYLETGAHSTMSKGAHLRGDERDGSEEKGAPDARVGGDYDDEDDDQHDVTLKQLTRPRADVVSPSSEDDDSLFGDNIVANLSIDSITH